MEKVSETKGRQARKEGSANPKEASKTKARQGRNSQHIGYVWGKVSRRGRETKTGVAKNIRTIRKNLGWV